jgi:hypothetical protein
MTRNLGVAVVALLLSPAGAGAGESRCVSREGQCTAVTVNGQNSVKLAKKTKKLLAGLRHVSAELDYDIDETRYQLATPIRGELEIQADRSPDSGGWFGSSLHWEAQLVPLGEVELQTHQELTTASSVEVGGAAPVGIQHVLDQKRLPPGQYLLVVTLSGDSNWDRQTLFFDVAE